MFRKLLPLAAVIVLVLGCKKKSEEGGGTDSANSNITYTIKVREPQQGDKSEITVLKAMTVSVKVNTPKGNGSKSYKMTVKDELTETLLDMPAGADHATKATREYNVAEKSEDGGPAKSMSYAKKTVLIEKKGGQYNFTVNGTPLPINEAQEFRDIYEKPGKMQNELILPKKAVGENEKWSVDQHAVKNVADEFELPVNVEKSSASGCLTKVYTKNGQQWGVIEFTVDLVLDGVKDGRTITGNFGMVMMVDTLIDGSSHDGTWKTKMNIKMIAKQTAKRVEAETIIDVNIEETRTTVK